MKGFHLLIVFSFFFLIGTPSLLSHNYVHSSSPYLFSKDLKKGQFLCLAKKELKGLLAKENLLYASNSDIHPGYTIDTTLWINLISRINPHTPLVQNVLEQIINTSTPPKTVQEIEELFKVTLNTCNHTKWLKAHYETHKIAYTEKSSLEEIATKNEFFKYDIRNDFESLLKSFQLFLKDAINDSNYPPNNKKEVLAKKELEALTKEFRQKYQEWLSSSNDHINKINKEFYQKVVQKDVFIHSAKRWGTFTASAQPELADLLLKNILDQLDDKYISLEHYAKAMKLAMQPNYIDIVGEETLFKNWKENRMLPNLGGLIITLQTKNQTNPYIHFNQTYQTWHKTHYNVLDKHPEWSSSTRFDKIKVFATLESVFNFEGRRFLLPIFAKHFKDLPKITDLEAYNRQWKKAMDELIQAESLKKNFDYTDKDKSPLWLDKLVLPSQSEIYSLFDPSNRP